MSREGFPSESDVGTKGFTRRGFLSSGALTVTSMLTTTAPLTGASAQAEPETSRNVMLTLNVNGVERSLPVDGRSSLLDVLREELHLTGTKKGCDHGQCGACTVHVGGNNVLSCLTLAQAVREPVVTIEGLCRPDEPLHPMQQAFIECDAFQCGYCTAGQILSGISCVDHGHATSGDEIREFMSGNLCRCGAYPHIVAAIQSVARIGSKTAGAQ